ncbi:hypothetical protein BBJ28_00026795 [Nothophytophthora sp. Chile5]|nr:hypothetical protein BBJ28_00026795 [Nothophytophthora sp. Chile5]
MDPASATAPPVPTVSSPSQVPTYRQHARRSHEAKSSKHGYHRAKSRKKRYMNRRAPVRDSRRVYRVTCIQTKPLGEFRALTKGYVYTGPTVLRVAKTLTETQNEESSSTPIIDLTEASEEEIDGTDDVHDDCEVRSIAVIETGIGFYGEVGGDSRDDRDGSEVPSDHPGQSEAGVVDWPLGVARISHTENPDDIWVPDLGSMHWCGCKDKCRADMSPNAATSIFAPATTAAMVATAEIDFGTPRACKYAGVFSVIA